MKSYRNLLTLLVAVGCFCVPAATLQAQDHDAMVAAAQAMDEAFVAAVNSGDTEKIADLYWNSPGVVSYSPVSMADRGYEAVMMGFKGFLEANAGAMLELHDQVHIVAGEYVMTYGLFTMTVPSPDGPQVMQGRFTDLKGERDGKWVYIHDHASVPLPPPPSHEE